MIICIEGADRRGKTTQAALLAEHLKCPVIKFPNEEYDSGQTLRNILNKEEGYPFEAMSFQALQIINRFESQQAIVEAEMQHRNVILDRYTMSGIVYALADGLPEAWVRKTMSYVPAPDFTIVLYGEPYCNDTGIYGDSEYQKKINELYLQELNRHKSGYVGINVTCKTVEKVHEIILACLPEDY